MVGSSSEENKLHILVSSQFADILMKTLESVFVISLCAAGTLLEKWDPCH